MGWLLSLRSFLRKVLGRSPDEPIQTPRVTRPRFRFDFGKFPYPCTVIAGIDVFQGDRTTDEPKAGIPVVLGDDYAVANIFDGWDDGKAPDAQKILDAAAREEKDFEMAEYRRREEIDLLTELGRPIDLAALPEMPARGAWPKVIAPSPLPHLVHEAELYQATVPAQLSYQAPAYLGWGGFNSCPPPYVHVIILKRLHDRYGAEVIAMTGDIVIVRVYEKPKTQREALALAADLYLYCNDLIDEESSNLSEIAARLMVSDYWTFWWD